MEWLRSLLARWKVQVSVVAGALVIATAYGTCTLEPPAEEVSENAPAAEAYATKRAISGLRSILAAVKKNSAPSKAKTTITSRPA